MGALADELIYRMAWLLAATSVALATTAVAIPNAFG